MKATVLMYNSEGTNREVKVEKQLLQRFVEWAKHSDLNEPVRITEPRELAPQPPLFQEITGEVAEFYSAVTFSSNLYPGLGQFFVFVPLESSRALAEGWALVKNPETAEYELDPDWDRGECVFFGHEAGDGAAFVHCDTGIVYGMLTGSSEKMPLAPSLSVFLHALFDVADIQKEIMICNDDEYEDEIGPKKVYLRRAIAHARPLVGEKYWPGFSEYLCLEIYE
ncbi:hypothetical protein CFELI_13325 [Corynebacterium felinum]|nr:hypothetical protein CFELI_13325 [Corynebacterium felinum]